MITWHIVICFIFQLSQPLPYLLGQAKLVKPWVTSLRSRDNLLCVLVRVGRMALSFCKSHFLRGARASGKRRKPLAPRPQGLWKSPVASDLTSGNWEAARSNPCTSLCITPFNKTQWETWAPNVSGGDQMSLCPPLPSGRLLLNTSPSSTATSGPAPDLEAEVWQIPIPCHSDGCDFLD